MAGIDGAMLTPRIESKLRSATVLALMLGSASPVAANPFDDGLRTAFSLHFMSDCERNSPPTAEARAQLHRLCVCTTQKTAANISWGDSSDKINEQIHAAMNECEAAEYHWAAPK